MEEKTKEKWKKKVWTFSKPEGKKPEMAGPNRGSSAREGTR